VELGERTFNVQPSESRTFEAQTATTPGLHQWLWDYSKKHGTSACSSRSRPTSPCALVRLGVGGLDCNKRSPRPADAAPYFASWFPGRHARSPWPFLVRVLDAIVYPDLPEWLVVGVAVVVCVAIMGVYLRRYLRRRVDGMW
jgi:hypothetical protein